MKVSIITVVLNGAKTIEDCIKSVLSQKYPNIDYIIIDGESTDGTLDIIKKYEDKITYWVSEPDKGLYDAMNKGIKVATGDIVGILNSDDIYNDEFVIEDVVKTIAQSGTDSCYGDLAYVDSKNPDRIIRYWRAGNYHKYRFKRGWHPPHPTFFVKRTVYEKYGNFDLSFPISADYELMLRFLYKHNISCIYLPRVLVKMRTGGKSAPGIINTIKANIEVYKAWKKNKLNTSVFIIALKPLSKVQQFFMKNKGGCSIMRGGVLML